MDRQRQARLRKELRKMSKIAEELYRDGKIETAKAMLAGGERVETIVKSRL